MHGPIAEKRKMPVDILMGISYIALCSKLSWHGPVSQLSIASAGIPRKRSQ